MPYIPTNRPVVWPTVVLSGSQKRCMRLNASQTVLHLKVGKDPAQLRMENFIKKEDFPWKSPTGWEYDSGDYHAGLKKAMEAIGYDAVAERTSGKKKER